MIAPLPKNEVQRLEELRAYEVLDTPPETAFDRVTQLAARIFDVPVALVSLLDEGRQWFKSCYGLDTRETPRDLAFCAHTLLSDQALVAPDMTLDPRFADNPLVTGEPHIRFYAGAPLVSPRGLKLGTLCIVDFHPREFDAAALATLSDLAAIVMDELELRLADRQKSAEIEERKRAEAALSASEAHFRALIENAQDIISVLSPAGEILYESPSLKPNFGYWPEEVVGRNAFEFIHPDDVDLVRQRLAQVASGDQQGVAVEFRFLHRDGSWRWLEAIGSAQWEYFRPETGEDANEKTLSGFVINSRDITARKHMEAELREEQERFFNAFDLSPIGIALVAPDGRWLRVNRALCAIVGYDQGELLTTDFQNLTHPDDLAADLEMVRQLLAGECSSYQLEKRYLHKNGGEVWVTLNVSLVRDEGGAPQYFISQIRDITEAKRVEERLRLLESAVVNANDAILITEARPIDEPGPRILYANEAFTRETGYTPEEVIGRTPRLLQGPDTSRAALDEIRAALEKWRPSLTQVLNYRKDGTPFWVELSIVPVADEKGWYTHWVSIQRDITEQKQNAAALSAAKEEAEKANRAKSEFLSRMSHELRTPLNAILGFGQLLEMAELPQEDLESARQITRAGRHLLALINEVLDISRIETGQLAVSLEAVSLDEVLAESLGLVRPLAAETGVLLPATDPLQIGIYDEEVFVRADRQRLRQVLINLLSNAIKYNRNGGSVGIATEETDGDKIRLGIRDTGPGIAPENLERVFTPFDRLGAENGEIEGTGIGLPLSQRLTQLMNGVLSVESQLGSGTTFWLELPRALDPALSPSPQQSLARANVLSAVETRWLLLYVEDNLSNLQLLQRVLAHRPEIKLINAKDGAQGLELARAHRPNLILLDLHLPIMQGQDVLHRLRADENTRDLPVIILSADATPGQVERLISAGAQAYLTKPFNVRELLRALSEHMRVHTPIFPEE
jgi:PAS domain S-box-containing protein